MTVAIAPSILSADFGHLADQVAAVERGGADFIHVDVMDGRFVPNLTIGVPIVRALRAVTALPLDVHLMIVEPERHLERFVSAGASMISVHVETSPHLHRTVTAIKALGAQAGVAINPGTPPSAIEPILPLVDYVVVMSVNPGFAGQTFIPESTAKIRAVRAARARAESAARIEIDGGVHTRNAREVAEAGADILVAASAIFGDGEPGAATERLRDAALAGAPVAER